MNFNRMLPKPAGAPCSSPLKVAILISGQLERFIYRDQTEPLFKLFEGAPMPGAGFHCPPIVDVFIALQTGQLAKPFKGQIASVPYANTSTPADIRKWYVARGARKVVVKFISLGKVRRMEAAVRKFIRHAKGGKLLASQIKRARIKWHWQANLRQYYMRSARVCSMQHACPCLACACMPVHLSLSPSGACVCNPQSIRMDQGYFAH